MATEEPVLPTETAIPTEVPTEVPTVAPEPRTDEYVAIADTSVTYASPEAAQSGETVGSLQAGGADTAVTYISFSVDQVGAGIVTEAYLVVTGNGGGGPGGPVGLVPGYIVDEAGTYLTLPTQDISPAWTLDGSVSTLGTVGAGEVVYIDVTRSVQADGQYTFVILGDAGQVLDLSSREGGSPPKLVLKIQD